jgi:hypothetical protein
VTDGNGRWWQDGRRLEFFAAVVLGLAAIAVAWASFQSSLWGGIQDSKLTESVLVGNEATDAFQQGDTIQSLDQVLFVEYLTLTFSGGDPDLAEFVLSNMSPEGQAATAEWFESDLERPFDSETYQNALYSTGLELQEDSAGLFEEAATANENADKYDLATTILALVLFFAGIATLISRREVTMALLGVSAVLLVGSVIYVLTLPTA